MPELPEVEVVRQQLEQLLVGARINSIQARHVRYEVGDISGSVITAVERRGKYIKVCTDRGGDLLIHLGMTGQLLWDAKPKDHVHFELGTNSGTLYFRDTRRFGSVRSLKGGEDVPATLRKLGQEPGNDFDANKAARLLQTGGTPVKARLLAQHAIAGVGNYIADEALHRAGIHPDRRTLSGKKARLLAMVVNQVIVESIAAGGVSERDYVHVNGGRGSYQHQLQCYGRVGLPCLKCGTILEKIRVAGRGSTFCRRCQPVARR